VLTGLAGVQVLVEKLEKDVEQDGLEYSAVQTDVELKLQAAGIKALTQEEDNKADGMPFLYVKVGTLKLTGLPNYIYVIEVNLEENVLLIRGKNLRVVTGCTTWKAQGIFGVIGSPDVRSLRDNIKDKVDSFINDWMKANPKGVIDDPIPSVPPQKKSDEKTKDI
jgi:hypothetical protein